MQKLTGAVLIVDVSGYQRDLGCESDASTIQFSRTQSTVAL